jgi:hypothetical protein
VASIRRARIATGLGNFFFKKKNIKVGPGCGFIPVVTNHRHFSIGSKEKK